MNRKVICSQYNCLSCPLSIGVTGKECDKLTEAEIDVIMIIVRSLEEEKGIFNLNEIFSYIRAENRQQKE